MGKRTIKVSPWRGWGFLVREIFKFFSLGTGGGSFPKTQM